MCSVCGCPDIIYALFSGGREDFCPACEDNHPYEPGTAPRRVQMIADGQFDQLRAEMPSARPCIFGRFCFRQGGDTACGECRPSAPKED